MVRKQEADDPVLRDVCRRLRNAGPFQIGGRGEDPLPHRPDLARHQRRVRHGGPNADRDVEAALDHVHHPVVQDSVTRRSG